MKKFFSSGKQDNQEAPSDAPPSYEQSQGVQNAQNNDSNSSEKSPYCGGNYGPDEYPPEKSGGENFGSAPPQENWQNNGNYENAPNHGNAANYGSAQPPPGTYTVPPNTYTVAPQKVNIAYETDGRNTRPGYAEYVQKDNERVAQGDFPKPREAFGRGGAPLVPSKKGQGSSGVFPGSSGASGPTYYNSSRD